MNPIRKVMVSGCFDLLHSGHVAFLNEAATFGKLYVCLGSDKTVMDLKGRPTVNTEQERQFMVGSLKCVEQCLVSSGSGLLDFEKELRDLKPDVFIVNEDGHSPQKETLVRSQGADYIVLRRMPMEGLPVRSTTSLRTQCTIPFRIDLAGGWLDQPFVSTYAPGPVLTVSIEPVIEFNDRSGMASSSRNKAIELWRTSLPVGDPVQNARILFSYENPPGTAEVSGSQDALGICLPGLNYLHYDNHYWPDDIRSIHDETVLSWLEDRMFLIALGPRESGYKVLSETHVNKENAERLAYHAQSMWEAILKKDLTAVGAHMTGSFRSQLAMFPLMADEKLIDFIQPYASLVAGYKLSGAGGGGYLVMLSETPVKDAIRIRIRRKDWL